MLNLNFNPFPVIETERLILRQLNVADAADLFFVRTHSDVLRNTNMAVHQNVAETEAYIEQILENENKGVGLMWAIALKDDLKLIGTICYWNIEPENDRAETGYILHPDLHGKGLMGEALKGVIPYGFNQMKLRSIIADIHKDNIASVKLALRNGFVKQDEEIDETDPDREIYVLESK
jgi:ribosomal-protein-alanine N-acetyltransferase